MIYSITSSASESRLSEILRPSAFAVLRLTTSSNFVGCWTGKSAGLAPLRIARSVDAELPVGIGDAHAIAQQSAGDRVFAELIDGRQALPCRERDDPVASCVEKGIGCDHQRPNTVADQGCERGLQIVVGAGFGDYEPQIARARRLFELLLLARCWREGRIHPV